MGKKEKTEGMLSPYRVLDLTDEKGHMCGKMLGDWLSKASLSLHSASSWKGWELPTLPWPPLLDTFNGR